MKTEVKKIDGAKAQLSIAVGEDVVKTRFAEVFKKISQNAKLPGFRAGHLPRDMLEKNFFPQAREQVLKELLPELYNQAIEKEKLQAVDLPQISEVEIDRGSLSFKATVEIAPEVKLKEYKGIKVSYQNIQITADEIKRSLDALKESRKLPAIDDGVARALGYPTLSELEKFIEKQLYIQKEDAQRQNIEHTVIEAIAKEIEFKLPRSMVERQLQDMLKEAKVKLALRGLPEEKINQQEQQLAEELRPQAARQVKIYLILSEIAKKENIVNDEQMSRRVMEFLLQEADWQLEEAVR